VDVVKWDGMDSECETYKDEAEQEVSCAHGIGGSLFDEKTSVNTLYRINDRDSTENGELQVKGRITTCVSEILMEC
jgi:hypothetical protein